MASRQMDLKWCMYATALSSLIPLAMNALETRPLQQSLQEENRSYYPSTDTASKYVLEEKYLMHTKNATNIVNLVGQIIKGSNK